HIGAHVAEINRVLRGTLSFHRTDAGSGAHACLRLERPVDASGGRVQGVEEASVSADENAPAYDGRLAIDFRTMGKPEGPFQLQVRHLSGSDPGVLRRLKTRINVVASPAVPRR